MSKRFFAVCALLVLAPSSLAAQETAIHPTLSAKFMINGGVFFPDKEVTLRVDGTLPTPEVRNNGGESFKYKESDSTGAMNFRWRFGEKWSVSGQYWKVDDSVKATLDEDVHWEDVVFKEGTFIKATTEIDVARVFFGRAFSKSDSHEFGLGIGLHWLEIGAGIEGQVFTSEGDSERYKGNVSADGPLPNLGIWYTYAFSPKWAVSARADWLDASVGDYSGGLTNAAIGIDWAIFDHFGLGASYNYFDINLDVDKSDWRGAVDFSQHGPFVQFNVHW